MPAPSTRRPVFFLACLLLAASCAASPARKQAREAPVPPDPDAITVFGRYQPSLDSLAPPGVEIGDLNLLDGRLVMQVRADGEPSRKALVRALERSGWYRDARWERDVPGGLREGEGILSVRPTR